MSNVGFPTVDDYRTFSQNPEKLKGFLSNVFLQVDTDAYMQVYDAAVNEEETTPQKIYTTLLTRTPETQGNFFSKMRKAYRSLKGERDTLAENVGKVMDPNRPKNGYAEVGMPGRMIKSITPLMGLTGEISVVNKTEDLLQSGWPKSCRHFYNLNYDPLPLEEGSCDVISCFAGLHHCPPDQLDDFVTSIYYSLRDGGIFLLRDHDTDTGEMVQLGKVIHSVFNSATNVTVDDENDEIRNFKSIRLWKALLKKHGFKCVSRPLKREGDTTENVLLKFVKVGSEESHLNVVREKLISLKNNYTRTRERTHMTMTEWFNVESSQNLGKYENFWDYPYFRDLKELWKNLGRSWSAARKVEPLSKVITSELTMVNAVITTLMTVEYLVKGIICSICWIFAKINSCLPQQRADANWDPVSLEYQKWLTEYGQRLEVTPYYSQKYLPFIKEYWNTFKEVWHTARERRSFLDLTFDRQTFKNIVTGLAMTADLVGRAATATPINAFLGGEENGDDRVIGIIVNKNNRNISLQSEDEKIKVVEAKNNPYAGLIVPRYKELESTLRSLVNQGIEIVEIAGQKEIQIDLIVDKNEAANFPGKLYERICVSDEEKKIVVLNIAVTQLSSYLNNQYEVNRIYDF